MTRLLPCLLLAIAALASTCLPSLAHETPSGWRYDGACCSERDCRLADPGEVVEREGGWLVVPSGTFVPHGDPRLHMAPDGAFHICNVIAGDRMSAFWCLYVPSFGS